MNPKRLVFLVVVTATTGVFTPLTAQLQTPLGYKERMQDKYQNPPQVVWVNRPEAGTLPAGVGHHIYRSQSMGVDVGFCVYLPPQYQVEPARRFPLIYHLHGAQGNELARLSSAELLHAGIVAGKWPPMIMVFPNGGVRTFYTDWEGGKFMSESIVIKELIPLVDSSYRTIAARHGRCIEGHSMGGRGSTQLAMKYPDMFCSLFNQAGNMVRVAALYDASRSDKFPYTMLGPEQSRYPENDPFELLKKNLERIRGRMRIMILCGTADTTHLPTVREFHQALVEAGVDHTYVEVDQDYEAFRTKKKIHDQEKLIGLFKPIWFDYHVESLRRAAEAAKTDGTQKD